MCNAPSLKGWLGNDWQLCPNLNQKYSNLASWVDDLIVHNRPLFFKFGSLMAEKLYF